MSLRKEMVMLKNVNRNSENKTFIYHFQTFDNKGTDK